MPRYQLPYKVIVTLGCFLGFLALISTSIAEIIFWDEFGTKFNFIAVDYLIYTNEIIGTLRESLPLFPLLFAIILSAALLSFIYYRQRTLKLTANTPYFYKKRLIIGAFILSGIIFSFYDSHKTAISNNRFAAELAYNGPYEFFSAFRNNILDYHQLYPTIEEKKALSIVNELVIQSNQKLLTPQYSLDRLVYSEQQNIKKYNIILIVVESLSAQFMGQFGNEKDITPYLDAIAEQSLFFTNIYATGTRTVRGLEALTLSIPPTPGSSIIRRTNNQGLFNIGSVFRNHDYKVNFLFGGYSYFDNLYNYFHGNDYHIIDRSNLKKGEVSFSNIWGVADEDILVKSLEIADQHHQDNQPFFSLIMTTSNHRPYTFPNGRIDLPSGQGRSAAVKYTDYAIGKFIEESKKRPWFKDTIFVITADHCASSAGKTDLPVHKYHIPLIIYAPYILAPQRIEQLASQIDIAPTILGLVKLEYRSKFFGKDILQQDVGRAFIGTYQLLGYLKDEHLVILAPNQEPKTYKLLANNQREQVQNLPTLVEEAISFYQTAYKLYITNKMKEDKE